MYMNIYIVGKSKLLFRCHSLIRVHNRALLTRCCVHAGFIISWWPHVVCVAAMSICVELRMCVYDSDL